MWWIFHIKSNFPLCNIFFSPVYPWKLSMLFFLISMTLFFILYLFLVLCPKCSIMFSVCFLFTLSLNILQVLKLPWVVLFSIILKVCIFLLFSLIMFFLYFSLLFTPCFGYTFFLLSPPQSPKGVICLIWGFSLAFSWRGAPNGAPYVHDQPPNVIIPYHFSISFGAEFPVCLN